MFAALPIRDQVGDRRDLQLVLCGELEQLRQSLHGAVVVDDFREQADRREPRKRREIDARFGMTGAHEHTAGARNERKDVARPHEIARADIAVRERLNRVGALFGRNAGGQAVPIVDRYGERGAHRRIVARDHRIEVQALCVFLENRRAQNAAGVADHERDFLGRRARRRHDQIPFVLPVIVVDDDDDFAGGNAGNDVFDGIELRGHEWLRRKRALD